MEIRTKRIHVCDHSKFVSLGRTGENNFRTIEIDVSDWISEDVEYRIIYSRPDGITYAAPATRNGNILLWELKAYDVEVAGFGSFEVRAYTGDTIGKSATFKIEVAESIQTNETQAGVVRPDWVDDIINKVVISDIEQTVTSDEDGGLNVFTVKLTDGSVSTFEVRNGTKGSQGERGEKGEQGDKGERGDTGRTGEPGPQGEKGEKGEKGEQGIPGEDGYTPQKGIDYWNDEDKAELGEYINDKMGEYIPQLENDIAALFERIGDIHTALDELHAYAEALKGVEK